tara:strand:+ start:153 stop:695 length:543 start_codon:yes stop_codon:yes gene_type:complete
MSNGAGAATHLGESSMIASPLFRQVLIVKARELLRNIGHVGFPTLLTIAHNIDAGSFLIVNRYPDRIVLGALECFSGKQPVCTFAVYLLTFGIKGRSLLEPGRFGEAADDGGDKGTHNLFSPSKILCFNKVPPQRRTELMCYGKTSTMLLVWCPQSRVACLDNSFFTIRFGIDYPLVAKA